MADSSDSVSQLSSWTRLLAEKSSGGGETSDGSSSQSVWEQVQQHFPLLSQQFTNYGNALHLRRAGIESVYHENDPPAVDKDDLVSPFHLHKELVVETRAALRYALSLFTAEESRRTIQSKAIQEFQWHRLLCYTLSQPNGDTKCRVMSARLLSNLVTCNHETASILASDLLLSPSQENVTERVRNALSLGTSASLKAIPDNSESSTWVDMMIACSRAGSRDAIGATVAALHNCLVALDDEQNQDRQAIHFAQQIASDPMLVNMLLRQMLPSVSVVCGGGNTSETAQARHADAATEWIILTLEKLFSLGMVPRVFLSAGGRKCILDDESAVLSLTPEQIVVLHCASHSVEEAAHPSVGFETTHKHPLGGEASDHAVVSSLLFLSRTFSQVSNLPRRGDMTFQAEDKALASSAWIVLLETLATALASDRTPSLSEARVRIGTETDVLSTVAIQLGGIVDALTLRNTGRKARDLEILPDDQRRVTGLVRLLGNLCFGCRHNQDAMRLTPVDSNRSTERSCLHLLLSCTSLSSGCFTLREWAIVALRSVLHNNDENQRVVERLQAQQPVQSTELRDMGVRVDLDAHGRARIVPNADDNRSS